MGYKESFHPRDYQIMLMREQQGMSFKQIGKLLHFSGSNARHLYIRAKSTQKRQYIQVLRDHHIDIDPILKLLDNEYFDNVLIVAYLEAEFAHILTPFRCGETGSPYELSEKIIRHTLKLRSNFRLRSNKNRPDDELPSTSIPDSTEVVQAVDVQQQSFIGLADQYKVPYQRLENLYRQEKILEVVQLASEVSRKYGVAFDEVYRRGLRSSLDSVSRIVQLKIWLEEGY